MTRVKMNEQVVLMMRIVRGVAIRNHDSRAALAMCLAIAVGVCGLSMGITGARYDDALATPAPASISVLVGDMPQVASMVRRLTGAF